MELLKLNFFSLIIPKGELEKTRKNRGLTPVLLGVGLI
jgi:hypothetical protein